MQAALCKPHRKGNGQCFYTGLFADPSKTPLDYKKTNLEAALKQMIDEAQARDGRLLHIGPISLDAVDPLNGYSTGI